MARNAAVAELMRENVVVAILISPTDPPSNDPFRPSKTYLLESNSTSADLVSSSTRTRAELRLLRAPIDHREKYLATRRTRLTLLDRSDRDKARNASVIEVNARKRRGGDPDFSSTDSRAKIHSSHSKHRFHRCGSVGTAGSFDRAQSGRRNVDRCEIAGIEPRLLRAQCDHREKINARFFAISCSRGTRRTQRRAMRQSSN
jgi:hypothetical protein